MVNIHRREGFTIVELLIVIVVIAILAAISIVSYTGIQQRANNTVTIEATGQLIKAYGLYAAEKGSLPTGSGCIGERYPGNTCLSQNGASACFGLGVRCIRKSSLRTQAVHRWQCTNAFDSKSCLWGNNILWFICLV